MGVEVVEDHPHLLGLGVMLVHQPPHSQGEIHRRASIGDVQVSPSSLGLEEREDVDHTLALVLVVVALWTSRLGGQGRALLGHHLVGQLVEAETVGFFGS